MRRSTASERGLGKPETFNFLGFTFICGKSRRGKFLTRKEARRDRMQVKLKEVKKELRKRMHQPIPEQGRWLEQVVTGLLRLPRGSDKPREHSAHSTLRGRPLAPHASAS